MAVVRIPEEDRRLESFEEIRDFLAGLSIRYERWTPAHPLTPESTPEEILAAYADEIEALKREGGYVTADVIDIRPETPNLSAMLAKFSREHWHDEDEVRFIIEGHGLFHIHPTAAATSSHSQQDPVVAIEVEAGDLIRVPRGTWHWFDLCGDRRIRAIRLFQDPAGWTPLYTDSGAEQGYLPVCMGLKFIPVGTANGASGEPDRSAPLAVHATGGEG
jgi:1,2-dihydroxy-3-keto-5-methylthiopentene dioxygenase